MCELPAGRFWRGLFLYLVAIPIALKEDDDACGGVVSRHSELQLWGCVSVVLSSWTVVPDLLTAERGRPGVSASYWCSPRSSPRNVWVVAPLPACLAV